MNKKVSGDYKQGGIGTMSVARFFDDWSSASMAVDALRDANFRDDQIGILARNHKDVRNGKTTDDSTVASNVATSAAVGGATGLLAALAALAIPGVGPLVAGGVLLSALGTTVAGAGIGAAAGGLLGALTSLGFNDDDAHYYDEGIRNGGTLVTVHASDRVDEATRILDQHGGRQRL